MIKRLRDEAGYSLVEVMVSILLLSIAIIPMVAMFDVGLNTATRASNYDKARSLAKKQMEIAQSLPYASVKSSFANAPCTFNGSGHCEATNLTDPDTEFSSFRYTIQKQYVDLNGAGTAFVNSTTDEEYMQITVVVGWGGASFNDTTYTTSSVKAK